MELSSRVKSIYSFIFSLSASPSNFPEEKTVSFSTKLFIKPVLTAKHLKAKMNISLENLDLKVTPILPNSAGTIPKYSHKFIYS